MCDALANADAVAISNRHTERNGDHDCIAGYYAQHEWHHDSKPGTNSEPNPDPESNAKRVADPEPGADAQPD